MAASSNDSPLKELKHDALPGYLKAFIIAFAAMGLYLAVILISSPGPAKGHDKSSGPGAEAKSGSSH